MNWGCGGRLMGEWGDSVGMGSGGLGGAWWVLGMVSYFLLFSVISGCDSETWNFCFFL